MINYDIPLIIRGRVIRDNPVSFTARRGEVQFTTPDANLYLDQLVLRNPQDMLDIQRMKVDEIIDYLVALGER
ncbi:MAG: long-chain-fatty-acyl-CoA reductase, partial [Candidimonas sp.]